MWRSFLLILSILAATALPVAADDSELVLLTSADNPPYEFVRSGEIVGFDIDLARIIAQKIGKVLNIKDMPFASIIPALMSHQGDIAMAALTPTDARRQNIDFSMAYQVNSSSIVLVRSDEFLFMTDDAIFPLVLLSGKTVAAQLGTHHEVDIEGSGIPNLVVRKYDSVLAMIAEMSNSARGRGKIYAIVIGTPEAKSIVAKNGKLCTFRLHFSDSFAVAMANNSPLREKINEIIRSMLADGTIKDLEMKWDINK
jgi:polar amino acid transport system substrate-binding protein